MGYSDGDLFLINVGVNRLMHHVSYRFSFNVQTKNRKTPTEGLLPGRGRWLGLRSPSRCPRACPAASFSASFLVEVRSEGKEDRVPLAVYPHTDEQSVFVSS